MIFTRGNSLRSSMTVSSLIPVDPMFNSVIRGNLQISRIAAPLICGLIQIISRSRVVAFRN